MSMRYWLRIALGAVLVFVLGLMVYGAGRHGKMVAEELAHGNSPISIPLAFIPFTLDGQDLGTIKRLELLREAPHDVSGANLTVGLSEGVTAPDCALAVTGSGDFDHRTAFRCAGDADEELVRFGRVIFEEGGARDLYLPQRMVQSWQGASFAHTPTTRQGEGQGASVQLNAGHHGISLNVMDALAEAGVQLLADSTGAVFHVRDDKSDTRVAMTANAEGFALQVIDGGESKVQMTADSSGLRMNVRGEQP